MLFNSGAVTPPDFAFPRDVSQQASTDLDAALRADDADAAINALIRLGLAESMISPDSVIPFVGRIDRLRLKEKNPVTRSLLSLLQATAVKSYYDMNRWELDRRTTVADSVSDITLYSGDRIKALVRQLAMESLQQPQELLLAPVTDYASTIEIDSQSVPLYPSVYDFAASYCIVNLLSDNADMQAVANRWVGLRSEVSPARVAALLSWCLHSEKPDYMALYRANEATPYAIELLIQQGVSQDNYTVFSQFIDAHPDYFRIKVVKSQLASFLNPQVRVSIPSVVAKDRTDSIDVTLSNARSLRIHLFRIPKGLENTGSVKSVKALGPAVAVLDVPVPDSVHYFDARARLPFSLPQYGRYIAVAELDGRFDSSPIYLYRNIVCSDLALLSSNSLFTSVVVDNFTGAPVSGVSLRSRDRLNSPVPPFKSDTQGRFKPLPWNIDRYVNLYPVKGDDRWSPGSGLNFLKNRDSRENTIFCNAEVKMELPVYHPGDTARLAAVIYYNNDSSRGLVAGREVKMELFDANYQPVDTVVAVTDQWGRLTPSFRLPDSGITGYYTHGI